MSSSSSSCTVSEDVCMNGASEEDIKACITALARSAPVDDESQWLAWLEDLAHHVEAAAVATGDPPTVKSWVVAAIQQPPAEQSKCRDEYEVAVFRPCILYYIHRAIVKARHCFGTPTENSDASSLSGSATGELVEASDQKLGTPPSYACHPFNDEDDHLPTADASRPSQEWDCLMQMMPERSSEAEEWLPWKEALRDGLNEEGQEADGLAHAPKVRSLINLCGLGGLWCAAWRRILTDDLITPMVALGCRKDFNVAVLSPLLRYFSTIIPELIEPAGVASFSSGCGSWKAMVCWTMARLRCRGPSNSNGRNIIIDRRDQGIFAMIRDYPYSTQALIDLSWCIKYLEACKEKGFEVGDSPSLMVQLAASIQLEFHRRLLIPSAHTSDVLKLYLRTFNSVNVLLGGDRPEAARKIFDWICEPVVAFLQGRSDTVRCVVAAMLEGGSENGWDEDSKPKGNRGPGVPVARLKRYSASGEWLELYNFETPVMPAAAQHASVRLSSPPLVSAAGGRFIQVWDERFPPASRRGKRESTEAQMLPLLVVGVYGSEDIFIREYRELMCQRLLGVSYASNPQAESTRDANNLITLKKKFGKDALQPCDVILHDVENSKKVSTHVLRRLTGHHRDIPEISALIVSRHFWPSSAGRARIGDIRHYHQQYDQLRLQPCIVEEMLSRFSIEYELTCGQRELMWLRTEGYAVVDITINGTTNEVTCPLLALTVLAVFEDDSEPAWTFTRENILQLVGGGMDEDAVNYAIRFWTSRHVLIENPNGTISVNE